MKYMDASDRFPSAGKFGKEPTAANVKEYAKSGTGAPQQGATAHIHSVAAVMASAFTPTRWRVARVRKPMAGSVQLLKGGKRILHPLPSHTDYS